MVAGLCVLDGHVIKPRYVTAWKKRSIGYLDWDNGQPMGPWKGLLAAHNFSCQNIHVQSSQWILVSVE